MNTQRSWVEALNINPDSLTQWSSQAPAGKPLLVWCLEQGHIALEDYFNWAQEFYGLPTLDAGFFQQQLDSSLLEQSRTDGGWHPWRFPVSKWDDITLVACVEPPTDEDRADVRYVLADPRAMSEVWGPSLTHVNVAPLPKEEVPAGFNIETKPFVLNIDDSLFATPAAHAPPAVKVAPAPPAAPVESILVIDEPSAPKPAPTLKVVPNEPEKSASPKAPKKAQAPANEEEAVKKAFAEVLTKYNHVVVMKCSEQKAKLYRSDPSLMLPKPNEQTTVDLSYPTFLRIVAKTLLPYHGYLIDSPAHRDFFESLGISNLPACVTAVPIKDNGKVLGMLVAIGGEDQLKSDYLGIVSHAAHTLGQAVSGSWSAAS